MARLTLATRPHRNRRYTSGKILPWKPHVPSISCEKYWSAEELTGYSSRVGTNTRAAVVETAFRGSICCRKYSGHLEPAPRCWFTLHGPMSGKNEVIQARVTSDRDTRWPCCAAQEA